MRETDCHTSDIGHWFAMTPIIRNFPSGRGSPDTFYPGCARVALSNPASSLTKKCPRMGALLAAKHLPFRPQSYGLRSESQGFSHGQGKLRIHRLRLDNGSFPPGLRHGKWEIHTVFLHFSFLAREKNLSLPALADGFRASQKYHRTLFTRAAPGSPFRIPPLR